MLYTVSDTKALTATLKLASSGDTVALAPGDYGTVTLQNLNLGGVTITSSDPFNEASISSLKIKTSSGLTFDHVTFDIAPQGANFPVQVLTSSDIHFNAINVHGSMNGNPVDDQSAMLIRNSSNVTITGSEFQELETGVAFLDSDHVTISGNSFHDLAGDGAHGGGTSNLVISSNVFTDFHSSGTVHPDAIQLWTTNTTVAAHDIEITGNVITRGDGNAVQGIFIRDQVGTLPFQHVQISNNVVVGEMLNGIYIWGGQDVVISDNKVVAFEDTGSRIVMLGVDRAILADNEAWRFTLNTVTNLSQTGSSLLGYAHDNGEAVLQDWASENPGSIPALPTAAANAIPGLTNYAMQTVTTATDMFSGWSFW